MELRNISQIKYTPSGNIYLFTGMIRCPICGAAMCGLYANRLLSPKTGERKLYTYYRCSKGGKYKLHKINSLNQDTVEKYLLENLDRELNAYIVDAHSRVHKRKNTTSQQNKIRDELRRVNYMFEKGRISEDEYEEKYRKLNSKLDALIYENNVDEKKIIRLSENVPENWRKIYDDLDQTGKQRFWHNIISSISIDESFHITGFKFL